VFLLFSTLASLPSQLRQSHAAAVTLLEVRTRFWQALAC